MRKAAILTPDALTPDPYLNRIKAGRDPRAGADEEDEDDVPMVDQVYATNAFVDNMAGAEIDDDDDEPVGVSAAGLAASAQKKPPPARPDQPRRRTTSITDEQRLRILNYYAAGHKPSSIVKKVKGVNLHTVKKVITRHNALGTAMRQAQRSRLETTAHRTPEPGAAPRASLALVASPTHSPTHEPGAAATSPIASPRVVRGGGGSTPPPQRAALAARAVTPVAQQELGCFVLNVMGGPQRIDEECAAKQLVISN